MVNTIISFWTYSSNSDEQSFRNILNDMQMVDKNCNLNISESVGLVKRIVLRVPSSRITVTSKMLTELSEMLTSNLIFNFVLDFSETFI